MRRRRNTPKGRRGRAGATGGRVGTARTSAPAPARPGVGDGSPSPGGSARRSSRPETIVRCRAPGSRGARGVGEARGGRGDCDSGPGTRVSAVTCRAPPPAGLTPPRRAAPGGSPAGAPGPSFPLWRRRLGPQGRAGCKKCRLRFLSF